MSEIEVEDINKRIRKGLMNILGAFNKEEHVFDNWKEHISKVIFDDNKEREELIEELDKVNTHVDDLKLTSDSMSKTLEKKQNLLNVHKSELSDLRSKYDVLVRNYQKLEQKCMKTKQECQLTDKDKKIFELSRKKLDLYGECTNVKWDYTTPLLSSKAIGYVSNPEHNYLHAFEVDKKNKSKDLCVQELWEEIERGTGEDWSDIVAMPDVCQ